MSTRFTTFPPLFHVGALLALLVLAAVGCAHHGSPVDPSSESGTSSAEASPNAERMCWGIWEVAYDTAGRFEAVPLRAAQYRVNVTMYLQPPAGSLANLGISIVDQSQFFSIGRVIVDVSLGHPFPKYPEYAGFDVLGVFIHNGGYTARHDSRIRYARPGTNAVLSNADGYTRWMNPSEFPASGIGGYTEGRLGTRGASWTATANPYKYFCDGLVATEMVSSHYGAGAAVSDRGVFRAGRTNTRRYDITFAMSGGRPVDRFQYAVVASWVEPNHVPPSSVPGDFPQAANMTEPFYITADTDGSTVYYNSSGDKGGDLLLTLEIFDQGARTDPNKVEGQINQIIVESPNAFIPGSSHMLTFGSADWTTAPGSTQISQKFVLDCGAVDPQGPDPADNPIFVAVRSQDGSYNTGTGSPYPSGHLRAFQCFKVPMTSWNPQAPGNVTGFEASDSDPSLGQHEVELTWNEVAEADDYRIQRKNYNTDAEQWEWVDIHAAPAGQTSWIDINARYCGSSNPIEYRIKARNAYGESPGWATDTGYPKMRGVRIAFWCVVGAAIGWQRAIDDFTDCNSFWNDYGFEFIMENSGSFFWVTNPAYLDLQAGEDLLMHSQFGQVQEPDAINVYYVRSAYGSFSMAYCMVYCPGSVHNTQNVFIVLCLDARNAAGCFTPAVLAHECGHALARFWDLYLMDMNIEPDFCGGNNNGVLDPWEDCSCNTWCTPPMGTPPLYCNEDGGYQYNLMWYSYCGAAVSSYSLSDGQYIEANDWVRTHESHYPLP